MAKFFAKYPTSVSSNPSVGLSGAPAPLSSTQVAGLDPSGSLVPLSVDAAGNINTNLPLDAATETKQNDQINLMNEMITNQTDQTTLLSDIDVQATASAASLATIDVNLSNLELRIGGSLVPAAFDEVNMTYTGDNVTTVEYKSLGTVVKTLTLTYSGSNLINVVAI